MCSGFMIIIVSYKQNDLLLLSDTLQIKNMDAGSDSNIFFFSCHFANTQHEHDDCGKS